MSTDNLSAKAGNSRFVARMIESHSILGLAFAALIYVVSLTGAFAIFNEETEIWENAALARPVEQVTPEAYEAALAGALAQRQPGGRVINLRVNSPTLFAPVLAVRLNENDAAGEFRQTSWFADPDTGRLLGKLDAPLAHLIEQLHVSLHLPNPWGPYLVGLLGVCMFSLILSGILAHPAIFRDAFKLRLDRNRRIAWTDVHNRLSVWGLPFHLVLTFTGGFLGLAGLIVGALAMIAYEGDQERALGSVQGPQAIEGRPITGVPPIASMVAEVRKGDKPIELIIVKDVDNAGGITQVAVRDADILDSDTAQIFRNDGQFLETYGGADALGGIRALAMVQPLHFGTFGGYPVKFLYFVMALALTWVTSSGMRIWFARRAQQARPVPRIESAWRGMTLGLTLGLSAATLASAMSLGEFVLQICLVVWALSIAAHILGRWPAHWLARIIMGSAGIMLVVAATIAGFGGADAGLPLLVTLSITILGCCMIAFVSRLRGETSVSKEQPRFSGPQTGQA